MKRARVVLGLLLGLLVLVAFAFRRDVVADEEGDSVLEDHECLTCHGFPENETGAPYVDGHGYLATVHAKNEVECSACHENHAEYPHPKDKPVLTMQCGECHDDAFDVLEAGVHGRVLGDSAESPDTTAACAACHMPHTLKTSCVACHEDLWKDLGTGIHMKALGEGDLPFDSSPCLACHGGHQVSYQCGDCHEDVYEGLKKSIHAPLLGAPNEKKTAEACIACHGSPHGLLDPKDRRAPLHPFNVPRTCGACHFEHADAKTASVDEVLKERFMDDTHGRALMKAGLISAPTCVSCHGGHDVKSHEDPTSPVHPHNVSEDCGKCHLGILEHYRESVHGRKMATLNGMADQPGEPATCTDCHQPHGIERVGSHFKLGIIETCSGCHPEYGRTYKGTYHGRVSKIGFSGVASCDECHTAHDILPMADPKSSLHGENRTATCARCHEGATDSFASYYVHANPLDQENYPVLFWARRLMRGLIFFTWAIWGMHTILWLFRATRERKHMRTALEPVSGRWYRRWPWTYRAIHLTLVFSFLLLALTGIPLRFPDAGWAKVIMSIVGGPEAARFLHRTGAVLTFTYAAAFLLMIFWRRVKGERGMFRGPNSLLPNLQDLKDMKTNVRWFIKGGEAPGFDRWTYWEKFDFIAEAWGVFFIGITGLVMWYPMFFTSFLPGPVINLAHILHSYEALLATTFIFSMHFFNANLRPGKFPIDPLFLTGRISEEELRHERPREYERMRRDGRLEAEALPPPNERLIRRAYRVGGILLSIGILLLVLMLYAMFQYGID